MTIQTPAGKILFSSGTKDGGITGAMEHLVGEILKKAGPAASGQLAEAVAIKELAVVGEKALVGDYSIAIVRGKTVWVIETEGARWYVAAEVDAETGLLKIFHLEPNDFF